MNGLGLFDPSSSRSRVKSEPESMSQANRRQFLATLATASGLLTADAFLANPDQTSSERFGEAALELPHQH